METRSSIRKAIEQIESMERLQNNIRSTQKPKMIVQRFVPKQHVQMNVVDAHNDFISDDDFNMFDSEYMNDLLKVQLKDLQIDLIYEDGSDRICSTDLDDMKCSDISNSDEESSDEESGYETEDSITSSKGQTCNRALEPTNDYEKKKSSIREQYEHPLNVANNEALALVQAQIADVASTTSSVVVDGTFDMDYEF